MKSVFITGATGGIGRALCKRFSDAGWFVGVFDLDLEAASALATQLSGKAYAGTLNVTKVTEWQAALAEFEKQTGAVDLLINNAGLLESGPFESVATSKYNQLIDVNIKGLTLGCHSAFDYLKSSKGMLINLSSASALYGQPMLAVYSASKFYVSGLTEALSLEWEKFGVRVHDLQPLFVSTSMVTGMNAHSIKRLGVKLTPADVAEQAFALATSKQAPVHTQVGLGAKLGAVFGKIGPNKAVRWFNKKIGV